jgi:hypothetical protein
MFIHAETCTSEYLNIPTTIAKPEALPLSQTNMDTQGREGGRYMMRGISPCTPLEARRPSTPAACPTCRWLPRKILGCCKWPTSARAASRVVEIQTQRKSNENDIQEEWYEKKRIN